MRFVTLCLAVSALAVSAVALAAAKAKRTVDQIEDVNVEKKPVTPPLARVLPERYPVRFSTN